MWPMLVWTIIAVEICLAVIVYQSCDIQVAFIALAGVPALALIDWLARRGSTECRPTWFRGYLAWWCLVPFVCAVAGAAWVHYQKRSQSLEDIRQLASDVRQAVTTKFPDRGWGTFRPAVRSAAITWDCRPEQPGDLSGTEVEQVVANLITTRFMPNDPKTALVEGKGQLELRSEEARRFGELARVAGNDLRLACGDVDLVYTRAEEDTIQGFALAVAIQALFVLWIPVMLAVSIARAASRRRR
ncbi:MAG: hypothetical protein H7138_09225, partial [Myxococcales bacterium]|nr:hypothetical protein [Myxococcales bacterium]